MPTNLFSTYSTGENRVTASILAVLRSLALERIERLLGALLEEENFELVHFENQPSAGAAGVPDAIISASLTLLVETKIKPGAVNVKQLQRHLKRLDESYNVSRLLLVITPDMSCPPEVASINDERLVWASFSALNQAVDELLADPQEVVSEREAFLLRELQSMLMAERLLESVDDVLVVAARNAWPEYQKRSAYICQGGRTFRPVRYLAFYSKGAIHEIVARIHEVHDHVEFQQGQHKGRLGKIVDEAIADPSSNKTSGYTYKVMLLSGPDDQDSVKLEGPVVNDLASDSGRALAFTQGHRYVSLEKLRKATRTSELA